MPKLKGKSPHSRHENGKDRKPAGKVWMTGMVAKKKLKQQTAAASAGHAAARESRERAAEQQPWPEPTRKRAHSDESKRAAAAKRKRQRKQWEEHAAAAAGLEKDIGATATARNAEFAHEDRGEEAARQAAEYAVRKAFEAIKKHFIKGDFGKAAAVLGGLVRRPELRPLLPAAGLLLSEDTSLNTQMIDQLKPLLREAVNGKSQTTDESDYARTVFSSITTTDSPQKRGRHKKQRPSPDTASNSSAAINTAQVARRFEICQQTASRHLKQARVKRRLLDASDTPAYLIDSKTRVGHIKATREWIDKVWAWLPTCKLIRISPLQKDTLLIRGADGKKNVRVPRLFNEVGLTQVFLKAKDELNLPFGERTFRYIMPPYLRRLTHRRESCDCPKHLKMHRLHAALVHFRRQQAQKLGAAHRPSYDHAKASMAADEGACDYVMDPANSGMTLGFTPGGGPPLALRPARCWMERGCGCGGARARYKISAQEKQRGPRAPKITFTTYEIVEQESQRYQKKSRRSVLVKKTLPIGEYMEDHYVPELAEYYYHTQLDRLLCACEKETEVLPGDEHEERDFAEKMGKEAEDAAQQEHWDNTTVTMETAISNTYDAATVKAYHDLGVLPSELTKDEHNFHFSSYVKQDSPVVYHNHRTLIQRLKAQGRLKGKGSRPPTSIQDVDGCFGQYFSVRAAKLQAKLSKTERVTIFKRRCCPGHGKKKSDGAHAVIKSFGRERMAMKDEGDESKPLMEMAVIGADGSASDLASELHRVCTEEKEEGVQGGMNVKRQRLAKMEHRHFHLYKEEDVEWRELEQFKTLDPSTADERKRKLPHSGVKGYHCMLTEPALPEDKVFLRRWPCRCPPCKAELEKPVARRRTHIPKCTLEPMAQGLNDWVKCKIVPADGGAGGDESDDDDEAQIEMTDRLADTTCIGDKIAWDAGTDKEEAGSDEDGRYYIGTATSEAYELKKEIKESDWGTLAVGMRVINAAHTNNVGAVNYKNPNRTPRWYTDNPAQVVVPVEYLLHTGFEMEAAELPRKGASAQQKAAVREGAVELSEEDHEYIMDELRQR